MVSAALTSDRVLHYLARQVKFYSLSFYVTDIKRLFQRNKLYYLETCSFTEYVGYSQQHKYTGAPIVGIARWSVPRIGQGHLEVKW